MRRVSLAMWLNERDLRDLVAYLRAWHGIWVTPEELADRGSPEVGGFVANVVEKLQRRGLSRQEAIDSVEALFPALRIPVISEE